MIQQSVGLSVSPSLISPVPKHTKHQHLLALPSIWNVSPLLTLSAWHTASFLSNLCPNDVTMQGSFLSSPTLHCHPFPSDLHFYRTSVTAWYIYVSACLCVCSEDWTQVLVREALTELSPQLPLVLFCLFTVCLFTLHKKRILCFAQNSAWYTVSPQEVFVEEINCSLHKPFSLKRLDEFCFVSDPNYFYFLQFKKLKYNYIFILHPTPSQILSLLSLKFIVFFF